MPARPAFLCSFNVMRRSGRVTVALAMLACLAPALLFAQDPKYVAACSAALEKDRLETWETSRHAWAWFMSIKKETYNQSKTTAGLDVASKIPVMGDMFKTLTGSASFSDFEVKRTQFAEDRGYTSDMARERHDLSLTTSSAAYTAWSQCVQSQASAGQTPAIWIEGEDAQTVHVLIRNYSTQPINMSSQLMAGRVTGAPAGMAFQNGATLAPAAFLDFLVERTDPKQTLKLLVTTDAGHKGLYVESTWADMPPGEIFGTVAVSMDETVEEPRGTVASKEWRSPELGNVRCGQNELPQQHPSLSITRTLEMRRDNMRPVCQGGYLFAERTISVAAEPGRLIRAPKLVCHSSVRMCEGWTRTIRCELLANNSEGFCVVQSSSDPHTVTVVADQYERVVRARPAPMPVLGFDGTTIVMRVPKGARPGSDVFSYLSPLGESAVKLGKDSADQLLKHVDTVDGADAVRYVYRVNLKPNAVVAGDGSTP